MSSSLPRPPLDAYVVAHTHWDREWYHPVERFQQRLVALVGDLLAAAPDAARPFLLDGQAVVLEDVLDVHPEWEPTLRAHLVAGAIEAGPWYVLADELIPSGEAMVRNLLAGRQLLRRLGARPSRVCYSPDAFGHPAALPTIASGFGLDVAVLWRGYGGPNWPAGDTVRWRAPDGSELQVWHLPPDGYEFASALPTEHAAALERWRTMQSALAPRATTGVVLLTNGADHHARQPQLNEAVAALSAAAARDGATVRRASLEQWAEALHRACAEAALPVVTGELRDSREYTWSLQGTFATRSGQKRAMARADRTLRRDVEPWDALAVLRTGAGIDPALRQAAWRQLLRTMPHDTLCGCSVDSVARALDHRVSIVRSQSRGVRELALHRVLGRDATVARSVPRSAWHPRLVVRNAVATARSGVAEVELLTTVGDVSVGPGSAWAVAPTSHRAPEVRLHPDGLMLQVLSTALQHDRRESPNHYPDDDLVHACRALVWLPSATPVPATGLSVWPLTLSRRTAPTTDSSFRPVTVSEADDTITLDNGSVRVVVREGRVQWYDMARARSVDDALYCTWQADVGDAYTAAPRGDVRRLQCKRARIVARGPLRAIVEIEAALDVPRRNAVSDVGFSDEAATPDAIGPWTSCTVRVQLHVVLDAGAETIGVRVRAVDRARDHRLRLVFATGCPATHVLADAALGPVVRAVSPVPTAAEAAGAPTHDAALRHASLVESHVGTAPLHRWVAMHAHRGDGPCHTAIISDGLAEYEAFPNGEIAVTLVRATGELSRANLPERPGHAGWPARIPEAQGPGVLRARFGVRLGGELSAPAIDRSADDVLLPLRGSTWRDAPEDIVCGDGVLVSPPEAAPHVLQVHGFSLAGDDVVVSAIKPAEDGDGVVLRAINLAEAPRTASWTVAADHLLAHAVRLDEEPITVTAVEGVESSESIAVHVTNDGQTCIPFTLGARAVSSIRVRRAMPPAR